MPAGVGVLFNPALLDFVHTHADALDYLAVIPDRTWMDHGPAESPRFIELSAPAVMLEHVARALPLVMHSIGLSICSADVFDHGYIAHLAQWRERFHCRWASEHLSFTRFAMGHEANTAVALPVPFDRELIDLLVPRLQMFQSQLGCPVLLENNVAYIRFPEEEFTEVEFLNTVVAESGCGLLLDLHNLYTNARNHGFSAQEFLAALNLDSVVEIHVAGGDEMMGFHTDSHTGPVLEPVWTLLEELAPKLHALRGVTFEFHESSWPLLHTDGVLNQIARARAILAGSIQGA